MALGFGFDLMSQAVRQRPWTPRFLFGDGEQGAWYDPSDFATLYQDSAGTTPVTALGQPVGLMLDKSQGAKPTGPELIANGDFSQWSSDNPVNWTVVAAETAGSFVTQSGNAARIVSDGSYMGISQSGFTTGKVYRVEFDVLAVDTGFLVSMGGGSTVAIDSTGHKAFLLAAGASNFGFYRDFSVGAVDFTVTNVSVREIPGNHASQATTAAMPYVQARKNLLEQTEEFDQDPPWDLINATIDSNVTTAPNGTLTADKLKEAATTGSHFVEYPENRSGSVTFSVYAKASERTQIRLREHLGFASAYYDLSNGTAVASAGTASIQDVGNGWYRCIISYSYGATLYFSKIQIYTAISGSSSYTGDGTSGVYLWGAQLELGSSATTYQRVTTATDYADIGLPRYLEFDGVDDFMELSGSALSILQNKPGATLMAGARRIKTSASIQPIVYVSIATASTRAWISYVNDIADAAGRRLDADSFASINDASSADTSVDRVITGLFDYANATLDLRVDGDPDQLDPFQTAGNTSNTASLRITLGFDGRYAGMRLYAALIRDSVTSGALLDQTERFVARKTGVTL